ncbi:hypothetical protein GGR32_000435 [Mesonia hippocampi]|uniref:Uncharacterized protein n=1 Tax=Mesonia hippocampi TaxID=1628250 RepID=A0A840ENG9_9FLAO|nr:hypothetical protein [Mesonia hippocampi]
MKKVRDVIGIDVSKKTIMPLYTTVGNMQYFQMMKRDYFSPK